MRRLRIAVDCDDTLVPTARYFVDAYNREYGAAVDFERQHEDGYGGWGVGEDELYRRLGWLQQRDEYLQLSMYDDARDVLRRLAVAGHQLFIITSRKEHERELTERMIYRDAPGIFQGIEFVGWHNSKNDALRSLKADILVDDTARHLQVALQEGVLRPGGALLFGEFPWSRGIQIDGVHCPDWQAVETAIDRLATEKGAV